MIDPDKALGVDSFRIEGQAVAFDLTMYYGMVNHPRRELFHGVTIPFYAPMNIPCHFAANEPAKPPL